MGASALAGFLICIFSLFCVVFCDGFVGETDIYKSAIRESSEQCVTTCPFQNQTDPEYQLYDEEEEECSSQCHIEKCAQGCHLLAASLESSCQSVCNGTSEQVPPAALHCVMGCNDALNRYFNQIKGKIGTPPAPALVADSLTATSLSLEWDVGVPLFPTGGRLLVQWRYEEGRAAWHFCRNHSWTDVSSNVVRVDGLQPYTKYRFRVALLLTAQHNEPIVSEPSVVISTLPRGPPSGAPARVGALSVGPNRVLVSWEQGPGPNGPLASYVLQIAEVTQGPDGQLRPVLGGYSAVKDIPASESTHYMWTGLPSNRMYSVVVAMRNSVGEGPSASATVTTPPQELQSDGGQPLLVLASHHSVVRQTADLMDEPDMLFHEAEISITGVAVHVARSLLFISDSSGFVRRKYISGPSKNQTELVLTPNSVHFKPLDLSIDWLNDQLYVLGEITHKGPKKVWQVARCGLSGQAVTVAVAGLLHRPQHIEVDPYNGYLFWATPQGLYRLDLADISNGVKHEVRPVQILVRNDLSAFALDPTRFRLLVPLHNDNTVISVSLDGREQEDIRGNTQKPMFSNVTSIGYANGLFYWSNGTDMLAEAYHAGQDTYFHNAFPGLTPGPFVKVSVLLPSAQPVPVPVNPPTGAQAVLGSDLAQVSWQPPHILAAQGRGAWQGWAYEVSIWDHLRNVSLIRTQVNTSGVVVKDLQENTEYCIKVAAYTSSGKGPWSSEFRGRTLRQPVDDSEETTILWSTSEGLLRSDVTGSHLHVLVPQANLTGRHIINMAWYQDTVYMVVNTSQVFSYNLSSNTMSRVSDLESVGSIAVDWLGKKLYWAHPKQQLITRGSLLGTGREPLPMLAVARELNVDPVGGHIYYSTGHAVECATLHGEQRRTYYTGQLFSGKQVMGLTLDMEERLVFWIIRSYEGSVLYSAKMADSVRYGTLPDVKSVALSGPPMRGPLVHFGGRLLWLRDGHSAVFGDPGGRYTAVIAGAGLVGLHTVAVREISSHKLYNRTGLVSVIPEPVTASSIAVTGTWFSFHITWAPVQNVNYGQVFYEIRVQTKGHPDHTEESTFPSTMYPRKLPPYTPLDVSVRAFTYWGSASKVRASVFSPPAAPTAPENVRVYLTKRGDSLKADQPLTATLRWSSPQETNGPLLGFHVRCGFLEDGDDHLACDPTTIHQVATKQGGQYELIGLVRNVTYYFQVQAFTSVGGGPYSDLIYISTDSKAPLPSALVVTGDTIVKADCDSQSVTELYKANGAGSSIKHVAFIEREGSLFFVNDQNELMAANGSGKTKLMLSLSSPVISMSIDWIQRVLYWSQHHEDGRGSYLFSLDLNLVEWNTSSSHGKSIKIDPRKILSSTGLIRSLQVSPFTRSLFWVETTSNNSSHLLISNIDGSDVTPFFQESENNKLCNCLSNPSISNAIALDFTVPEYPNVVWLESDTKNVVKTDFESCICQTLANVSTFDAKYIAYDGNLYFANEFSVKTLTKSNKLLTYGGFSDVRQILQLGTQSYPHRKCLMPNQDAVSVQLLQVANRSSTSVTLVLPTVERNSNCANVALPTVKYEIRYKSFDKSGYSECHSEGFNRTETASKELVVDNLQPFSRYLFCVGAGNFYSAERKVRVEFGAPVLISTSPGAPSQPRDLRAWAVSPTEAWLKWSPPLSLHAPSVRYEVHWASKLDGPGVRTHGEQLVPDITNNTETSLTARLSSSLSRLLPNQSYTVWVRAFPHIGGPVTEFTDSDSVAISTYPDPEEVELVRSSARALTVSWTGNNKHIMEYSKINSDIWNSVPLDSIIVKEDGTYLYSITELQPKSQYRFRLQLWYAPMGSASFGSRDEDAVDNLQDVDAGLNENTTEAISSSQLYVWPSDNRFVFETLGDKPSAPGEPQVNHIGNGVYKVLWEVALDNGAPIQLYSLEGLIGGYHGGYKVLQNGPGNAMRSRRQVEDLFTVVNDSSVIPQNDIPYIDEVDDQWVVYYNGTDNYWIISDLRPSMLYTFRVRGRNAHGWGPYGPVSRPFDFSGATRLALQQERAVIIVAVCVPVLACVCLLATGCMLYSVKRRSAEKKLAQTMNFRSTIPRGPDVELATLRELPRRSNFIHSSNVLYSGNGPPTDAELAMLPHIARDQITLTKFLGSGAFGEVFEGIAKLPAGMKVAVKTLRKGASDVEKQEFLQEARLMGNFKHKHILQLLGVCLDNDPHFIIMELMEGGDLLSYLRNSRTVHTLGYTDLLGMCLDVAIGCRYLEEMHFVHRDLACRNCLVSTTGGGVSGSNPGGRIVKIGDFGLARDIYKNDYYRKEGEGLLPVRWMAPESLVDGVFTCQSDVWAFGVLCWEVMTLGQQPYPARTNLEVLHYVRGGGRLGKPPQCHERLHSLMLSCWSYNQDDRPTFKECVDVLTELKTSATPVRGFSNRCYMLQDENHNTPGESVKVNNAEQTTNTLPRNEIATNCSSNQVREQVRLIPAPPAAELPRYLELLSESESEPFGSLSNTSDGYEIPRGSFRTQMNSSGKKNNQKSKNIVNKEDIANLTVNLPNEVNIVDPPSSLDTLLPSASLINCEKHNEIVE